MRYFMTQILSALEYMHSKDINIIHRDLSLKNIFIGNNFDNTMQVKIGDFGMSIQLQEDEQKSLRNSFCGTYHFIAPEIYKNEEEETQFSYSQKNDIWALGVIFYTLLIGSNPFDMNAKSLNHLKTLIKNSAYVLPPANMKDPFGFEISDEARDLV